MSFNAKFKNWFKNKRSRVFGECKTAALSKNNQSKSLEHLEEKVPKASIVETEQGNYNLLNNLLKIIKQLI
jgi:hypothetical protein